MKIAEKSRMSTLSRYKKQILVVEDETAIYEALCDRLKKEGFAVLGASNGLSALEIALTTHPDLILLDIVIPKLDGMQVLEKIRKDDWGANVPIIILTNLDYPENIIVKAAAGRVVDYLVKADLKLRDVVSAVKEKLDMVT